MDPPDDLVGVGSSGGDTQVVAVGVTGVGGDLLVMVCGCATSGQRWIWPSWLRWPNWYASNHQSPTRRK